MLCARAKNKINDEMNLFFLLYHSLTTQTARDTELILFTYLYIYKMQHAHVSTILSPSVLNKNKHQNHKQTVFHAYMRQHTKVTVN